MSNTPMARTSAEIVERLRENASDPTWNIFGVAPSRLILMLPFEDAKEFLVEGASEADFTANQSAGLGSHPMPCMEFLVEAINDYLDFAWEKANADRGLSAIRSLEHLRELCWLAGWDDIVQFISDDSKYQCYGKPSLALVSTAVGYDWRTADNGIWHNEEGAPSLAQINVLRNLGISEVMLNPVARFPEPDPASEPVPTPEPRDDEPVATGSVDDGAASVEDPEPQTSEPVEVGDPAGAADPEPTQGDEPGDPEPAPEKVIGDPQVPGLD